MADNKQQRAAINGITNVPTGSEEFTAWWSSEDAGAGRASSVENIDEATMRIINNNASLASSITKPGTEIPIWQQARGATHMNTYPQQVINQLDNINLKRDSFVFFDIEALGTHNPNAKRGERMGYVSPTEIALQHTQINKNGTSKILSDINMVVKPGQNHKNLQELVNRLARDPYQTAINLSVDERRSLEDLILYSDKSNFSNTTVNGRKISTILRQNRAAQPLGIASLADASTINKMKAGLGNLQRLGTDPIHALEAMSDFFVGVTNQTKSKKGTTRLAGQNIRQYDLPVLQKYVEQHLVGKHANNSKITKLLEQLRTPHYLDTLQVENTLNRDIATRYPNLKLSSVAMSRKVMNYKGKYITPGRVDNHFAPYDVEMNGRVAASQIQQYNRIKQTGRKAVEIANSNHYISAKKTNLRTGDHLFAISGISGYEAGKYDAVYGADGKPISTMKGSNPLYRNSTYMIQNSGLQTIDGKDRHTLSLKNVDRGTTHFFVRDSLEEIQNIVHKNMDYVDSANLNGDHAKLARSSILDAASRRYNKMFSTESGGGVNLYSRFSRGLEAYQEGQKAGLSEEAIKKMIKDKSGYSFDGQWNHSSDSFVRDFWESKDRFAAEKSHYDKFLETIQGSARFKGNNHAQSIALSIFNDKLNSVAGRNTVPQAAGNSIRSVLPLTIDGTSVNVQISDDIDAIRNSLNRAIGHGHVAKNMSMNTVKGRLRQVVNQMRAKDQIRGPQAKKIMETINGLTNDDSAWYILRDISLAMNSAHHESVQNGKVFGLQTIDVEDPTKLVNTRAQAMASANHNKLIRQTVQETMPYLNRAYDGIHVPEGSKIQKVLATHDATMRQMANHPAFAQSQLGVPRSAKEVLDDLVKSYVDKSGKYGTTLFHGGRDEVVMAVYGKNMADQVKGMSYEQIMKNNNITTMHIPLLRENQNIRFGTQERIGRLQAVQSGQGMGLITGFEEVVRSYRNMGPKIMEMMDEGRAIEATNLARSVGRGTLESLSQNRSGSPRPAYEDPFRITESRGQNWLRRGTADFSNLAEKWFLEQYGADHEDQYNKIKQRMADNPGMKFADAMGNVTLEDRNGKKISPGLRWGLDMEDWLRTKGVNVNTHSIKNVLVNNDVRSFHDVGELTPFGMFNPGAREKHFKVMNYLPLQEDSVRANLMNSGYSSADADRILRLGSTTERGLEVFGNEVNYLSMRTAHANSALVAERFGNPRVSTAEGMFVLRKEMASAFTTTETKVKRLSEGATLDNKLLNILGNPADLSHSIVLDQPVRVSEAISKGLIDYNRKTGEITVGGIMRDEMKNGIASFTTDPITGERDVKRNFHATDYYSDNLHLGKTVIKGWDAEKQAVVFDVTRTLEDGDKMVGSNGLRGTVTLVPGAEMDRAGFAGIDAILPHNRLDHRDYGTYLRSSVDLAYDETRRQATAGKIALQDGLDTLRKVMSTDLGISENQIRLENNRIVLDSALGLNKETQSAKNVFNFLSEMSSRLGVDLVGKDYMLGQTGLAVSGTPKWQDSSGYEELGGKGKVRWGLKEIDMINDRLQAMSTGNNFISAPLDVSAIDKWLNSKDMSRGVQSMMINQTPDGPRMSQALTRTMLTSQGMGGMRPGEVIINTQGNKGDFGPDNEGGRSYAHVDERGVIHVSGDNFVNTPTASKKGGFLTVGDLSNTIIKMQESELPVGNQYGPRQTLGQAIQANTGTALVQLPSGLEQSHVRFISNEVATVGASDMAVLDQLQQKENQIWRSIKASSGTNSTANADKIRETLQRQVNEYHSIAARVETSSRDGSLAKTTMSAMMDTSGRFNLQGVNPAEEMTAHYQHNTHYVGRDRMSEMLFKNKSGMESRLAEVLGIDIAGMNLQKKADRLTVQNLVLDSVEREGLYGFVGRYPTNSRDTMQIARISIDPNIGARDRNARSTLATAKDLLGDFDGDFGNITLSHYGVNDRDFLSQMHSQMASVQSVEAARIEKSYQSKMLPKLAGDELSGKKITASTLAQEETKAWTAQRGGMYDVESTFARVNASMIGRADNMRYKLLNLANNTFDVLSNNGAISAAQASQNKQLLQEFGRVLSQDFISSKKFDVGGIADSLSKETGTAVDVNDPRVRSMIESRQGAMASFMEGLSAPNTAGITQMRAANNVLGLYKEDEFERMGAAAKQLYKLQGYQGNMLANESLGLGVSEGDTAKMTNQIVQGKAGPIVETPFVKSYLDRLSVPNADGIINEDIQYIRDSMRRGIAQNEQTILSIWNKMNETPGMGGQNARLTEEMLGHTAAQGVGASMKNFATQVFGGMGGGGMSLGTVGMAGALFGGIWATTSLTRSTPTPEGNESQQEGMKAAIPRSSMAGPTARVMENGEDINIRISGRDASNMSSDQISALVQGELNAMMPMSVNMNLNVSDNTQNMDRGWLQGIMTNAINFGNAF